MKQIAAAVANYTKGSEKIVRVYENVIDNYWISQDCTMVQYFVNALAAHKVLQKVVIQLTGTFGKFEITGTGDQYTVANKGKYTEKSKAHYLKVFNAFKEKAYSSFLQESKIQNQLEFSLDKKTKALEASIKKFMVDAMANGEDPRDLVKRLNNITAAIVKADLTKDVETKKAEIAAQKAANDSTATAQGDQPVAA